MIKVWILTLVFVNGSGSSVSTQQYQFSNQKDCLGARAYAIENANYVRSGFCLLTDKP